MAATAETIQTGFETLRPKLVEVGGPEIPSSKEVYLFSELDHDRLTRLRCKRWIASLSLGTTVETVPLEMDLNETNLLESAQEANQGSVEAMKMVEKNVDSAVYEACFKDEHVTEVTTQVNENGERVQFGQSTKSRQRNSLQRPERHKVLQEITEIEALNDFRIEDALRAGLLKDNYFVIASIVPDGVPETDLGEEGDGYFLDSLTIAAQITSESENNEVVTQTLFKAGVKDVEGLKFEDRKAKRYDIAALTKIYEKFGKTAPTTAAGFLRKGLLIPKEMMPNGAADFNLWFDKAVDETEGRVVERNPEDYVAVIAESRKREAGLADTRQKVKADFLRMVGSITKPEEAIKLLWKIVKKRTVIAAFSNQDIKPEVFGREAAPYIVRARQEIQTGNNYQAMVFMQMAEKTAVVVGCGGGASKEAKSNPYDNKSAVEENKFNVSTESKLESNESEESDKDCDFISEECPECHNKDVKTKVEIVNGKKRVSGDCGCVKVYDKAA